MKKRKATDYANFAAAQKPDISGVGTQAYKDSLAHYKALKAKKYALQQARRMMEAKNGAFPKGTAKMIGSLITSGISFANLSPSVSHSKAGKILSGLAPVIGFGSGLAEKIISDDIDKTEKQKANAVKQKEINKYLRDKRAKVRTDANTKFPGIQVNLTDKEVDRSTVAILRVKENGSDIRIDDTDLTATLKDAAFEALNLKRAKLIMESGREKDGILAALGVDTNASLEQVAAALKGE